MQNNRSRWRLAAVLPLIIGLTPALDTASPAQSLDANALSAAAAADAQVPVTETPTNPWSTRPVCASMFLKSDWELTSKQRTCDWMHNGVLSTGRVFTTAWSTGFSMVTDTSSERGDGFRVRYGRKWTQGAMAATGKSLGALIAHEDPRDFPPYLAMRRKAPPHGFIKRFGAAIARNVVTSGCVKPCRAESDIHKRFGLSRMLGAAASGAGGVAFSWDRPDRGQRAWHGMASAYAASFGQALFTEFKPEVTAAGGRLFRLLGGH